MLQPRFLLTLATILLYFSCNSDHSGHHHSHASETGQFEYQLVANHTGNRATEFGDIVQFHYTIYKGQKLITSSFSQEPAQQEIAAREFRTPIEEALMLTQAGDSLQMQVRYERVQNYLPAIAEYFQKGDMVTIGFRVLSVRPRAEVQQEADVQYALDNGFANVEAYYTEKQQIEKQADSLDSFLEKWATQLELGRWKAGKITDSGLEYWILNTPNKTKIQTGDTIFVYYALMVQSNKRIFDNSVARLARFKYTVGATAPELQVFHQAARCLGIGDQAIFVVPPSLAYGEAGSLPVVPTNANLILYLYPVHKQ